MLTMMDSFLSLFYRLLIDVVSLFFQSLSFTSKSSFVGLLPCGFVGLLELVAGLLNFPAPGTVDGPQGN